MGETEVRKKMAGANIRGDEKGEGRMLITRFEKEGTGQGMYNYTVYPSAKKGMYGESKGV